VNINGPGEKRGAINPTEDVTLIEKKKESEEV